MRVTSVHGPIVLDDVMGSYSSIAEERARFCLKLITGFFLSETRYYRLIIAIPEQFSYDGIAERERVEF